MSKRSKFIASLRSVTACAVLAFAAIPQFAATASAAGQFEKLLGSWGGSGTYRLASGKSEKLRCDAYYTGGGTQLGMVVRCSGGENKIEIRSKLSASGNNLSGHWEERTFNAEGTATGRVSDGHISLGISGAVSGSMSVEFSRSRQTVSISTQGTELAGVSVSLSRK
ncbi:MAG: hypothetical protein APF80_01670 [Alphaproteobacteria bacterium BRH_c36]|nr:MAG: hypothetical protein APF80_01670 [Alphaproteobacteria bacterium BRH_c36]